MSLDGQLDLAVLHVLGMDEEDVVEDVELLEERSAHEAVEVGTGHQPVAGTGRGSGRGHVVPVVLSARELELSAGSSAGSG